MKQRSAFSEDGIEENTGSGSADRATLRRRLADRLRQVIGNPVIEEKKLAVFDIVMSRRDVLKPGRNSLVVAGLVSAGVPPTVWARRDPSLGVHPCEVGLTPDEQASVSGATVDRPGKGRGRGFGSCPRNNGKGEKKGQPWALLPNRVSAFSEKVLQL